MALEAWIDRVPSRVMSPLKTLKTPKLETIVEEEKEEQTCDDVGDQESGRDCSIKRARQCVMSSRLQHSNLLDGSYSSFPMSRFKPTPEINLTSLGLTFGDPWFMEGNGGSPSLGLSFGDPRFIENDGIPSLAFTPSPITKKAQYDYKEVEKALREEYITSPSKEAQLIYKEVERAIEERLSIEAQRPIHIVCYLWQKDVQTS